MLDGRALSPNGLSYHETPTIKQTNKQTNSSLTLALRTPDISSLYRSGRKYSVYVGARNHAVD